MSVYLFNYIRIFFVLQVFNEYFSYNIKYGNGFDSKGTEKRKKINTD